MKKPLLLTLMTVFVIGIILWNIFLTIELRKAKRHPEKIEIFLKKNDVNTGKIKEIEDSLGVSLIVPEYENNQLNNTIEILSTTSGLFGEILAAIAIFIAIIAGLGLYEINTWRTIREQIQTGEEEVKTLSGRVQNSILEIETKKRAFEELIPDIEKVENTFNQKIKSFQKSSAETHNKLEELIRGFNSRQDEIISDNFIFRKFKDNIFGVFQDFRKRISTFLDKDLMQIKEANAKEYQYPNEIKKVLKEYLLFYNFFSSLINAVSSEKYPLGSIDYFALGMASYIDKDFHGSKLFFEKAVDLQPDDHLAIFKLGTVCIILNDYDLAIKHLERVLSLKTDFYEASYNIGIIYGRKKNYAKAIKSFKEAIKHKSSYLEAKGNLAAMYIETKEFDRARNLLDDIIEVDSTYFMAFYNKSCLCSLEKNKQDTLLYLEKAIKLNSSKVIALAKNDKDFDWLRENKEFILLMNHS